jgi:hypothetical protein
VSVRVLSRVFDHSQARPAPRLVLIAIADAAHDDGIAWPSQANLARKTGLNEITICKAVRELVEVGELEVRKAQRGAKRQCVYRVLMPDLAEPNYTDLPFEIEPFNGATLPDTTLPTASSSTLPTANSSVRRSGTRARERDEPSVDLEPYAGSTGKKPPVDPASGELVLAVETVNDDELEVEPPPRRPRPRDPLWDAFVDGLGYGPETKPERGKWNRAIKELRDVGATYEQVRAVIDEHGRRWEVECTPQSVTRNWSLLSRSARPGANADYWSMKRLAAEMRQAREQEER